MQRALPIHLSNQLESKIQSTLANAVDHSKIIDSDSLYNFRQFLNVLDDLIRSLAQF